MGDCGFVLVIRIIVEKEVVIGFKICNILLYRSVFYMKGYEFLKLIVRNNLILCYRLIILMLN